MAFITNTQLTAMVAAQLKKAVADVNASAAWPLIIAQALIDSYGDIRRALVTRGYSQTQIDAWDDGATFQTSQGCYWALARGGSLDGYSMETVKFFDRRAELKTVEITNNAVYQSPLGPPAPISFGPLARERLWSGARDEIGDERHSE